MSVDREPPGILRDGKGANYDISVDQMVAYLRHGTDGRDKRGRLLEGLRNPMQRLRELFTIPDLHDPF